MFQVKKILRLNSKQPLWTCLFYVKFVDIKEWSEVLYLKVPKHVFVVRITLIHSMNLSRIVYSQTLSFHSYNIRTIKKGERTRINLLNQTHESTLKLSINILQGRLRVLKIVCNV